MTRREERFEIDVDASAAEVWERLTTPDGLASWFGTSAEIDLRIDGERVIAWGTGVQMTARIRELEPQRRLRVVYTSQGEASGAEEWLISSPGSVTRLTLINSFPDDDIDDWEGFFGDIRRGWLLFLATLKHGMEEANTPSRIAECTYTPAIGGRRQIWERVEAALAATPELTAGMSALVSIPPHSLLLAARDRTLLIDIEGGGDQQVLFTQASTHGGPGDWRDRALGLAADALAHPV